MEKWLFNVNDRKIGIPRKLAEGIESRIIFGDNVMFSVVNFEPNSKGKLHQHPEEQWGILIKGGCVRIQGNEVVNVKEGDFWFTKGNTPHTIIAGEYGATIIDIFSPVRDDYKKAGEGFGNAEK